MVRIIVGMRTHPELKVLNSMNCPNRGTQSFFSQFLLNQAFKQLNKRFFLKDTESISNQCVLDFDAFLYILEFGRFKVLRCNSSVNRGQGGPLLKCCLLSGIGFFQWSHQQLFTSLFYARCKEIKMFICMKKKFLFSFYFYSKGL